MLKWVERSFEFMKRHRPLWMIPILILLIILTLFIAFSTGRIHTPFIYSRF